MLRTWIATAALAVSTSAIAALPGITEFKSAPEQIPDAELSRLLDSHVASARVVALGETVHGSAGLLRAQTRIIRFLVEKHGFRLVVGENPTLRSLELSAWVSACTHTRSSAPVDVLYMPTQSDVAFWNWVCDFNRSHPRDPIVFRGMDVWDRPWEHFARIRALGVQLGIDSGLLVTVGKRCPTYGSSSWADIDNVLAEVQRHGTFYPGDDYEQCQDALTTVLNTAMQSARDRRGRKDPSADAAYELALSASTMLGWLGFYNYNWSQDIPSWNARDRAQGRNLMLLMQKHGFDRAIVAAHTSHTSHNRSSADWWGFGDIKSGIHFFDEMTGQKVFNIAFTAYEASGTQGEWLLPAARNSLDRKLHDAGHEFSFFTSAAAFLAEHERWWMQNQNAGAHENGVELIPRDHFDAFIFLDRSHLDRALPARPMWQP